MTPAEVAETFPEARSIAKKELKRLRAVLKAEAKHRRKLKEIVHRHEFHPAKQDFLEELMAMRFFPDSTLVSEHVDFLEKTLFFMNPKKKSTGKGVTQADIDRAKGYPISSLVSFNHSGFAPCLWHKEKTPSMKYYKKDNQVHCFGCGKHGDAITVAEALYNLDFISAIHKLNGDKPSNSSRS